MARKGHDERRGGGHETDPHGRGSGTSAREPRAPGPDKGSEDLVVFWTLNPSVCSECGQELGRGSLLRLEDERALCLTCADLDQLAFLPRGDAALTRRASKHSALRAIVLRFSRTRKRYERQGVLVEEEALQRAEAECLADADARAARQLRDADRRAQRDAAHVAGFARRIGELFPGCPTTERNAIAEHACKLRSGRVGRSAAAKELDAGAIQLAVRAHVRHRHTAYDRLLGAGIDRSEARLEVAAAVDAVMDRWRAPSRDMAATRNPRHG